MDSASKYEQLKEQIAKLTNHSYREAEVSMQIAELKNEIGRKHQQIAEEEANTIILDKKIADGLAKFKVGKENHILVKQMLAQQNDMIMALKEEILQKKQKNEDTKKQFEEMLQDEEMNCKELEATFDAMPFRRELKQLKQKYTVKLFQIKLLNEKIFEQKKINKLRNDIQDRLSYVPIIEFAKFMVDYPKKVALRQHLLAETKAAIERTEKMKLESVELEKRIEIARQEKIKSTRKQFHSLQIPKADDFKRNEISFNNEVVMHSVIEEFDVDEAPITQTQISQAENDYIFRAFKPLTYQINTAENQTKLLNVIDEPPKKIMKLSEVQETPQTKKHTSYNDSVKILRDDIIKQSQKSDPPAIFPLRKEPIAFQETIKLPVNKSSDLENEISNTAKIISQKCSQQIENKRPDIKLSPKMQKTIIRDDDFYENLIGDISQTQYSKSQDQGYQLTQLQTQHNAFNEIEKKEKVSPYFKAPAPVTNAELVYQDPVMSLSADYKQGDATNYNTINQENMDYNYDQDSISSQPLSPLMEEQNDFMGPYSPTPHVIPTYPPSNTEFNFSFGQSGMGSVFGANTNNKSKFSLF